MIKIVMEYKLLKKEQSQIGQLLCIFLVLIHHWVQASSYDFGSLYIFLDFFKYIGGCACCGFFFLSGYGLFESYKRDSNYWLKSFFRKRMVKVVFPYMLFCLLYYVIWVAKGDKHFSIIVFLKSLFGFNLEINGHFWFMQFLLLLYLGLYFSLILFKDSHKQVFSLFVYQCFIILLVGKTYGCISSFGFVMGVIISYANKYNILRINIISIIICLLVFVFTYYLAFYKITLFKLTFFLNLCAFLPLLIVVLRKLAYSNMVGLFSKYSFYLYLTNALTLQTCSSLFNQKNIILSLGIYLVCNLLYGIFFKFFIDKMIVFFNKVV